VLFAKTINVMLFAVNGSPNVEISDASADGDNGERNLLKRATLAKSKRPSAKD
jgi:hypothetical protein